MNKLLSMLIAVLVGCNPLMVGDTDRVVYSQHVQRAETICKMEPNILQYKQIAKCKHQSEIRWAIFEWRECVKREIVPDCGEMPSWRTMPFPDDADPTDDDPHTEGPN